MSPAIRSHARRRGTAIIYLTISMVVLFGFASLADDFGRVEVAKTQLQTAADAAAPSGALALKNVLYCTSAAANTADGSPVVLGQTADVDLGIWTAATKTFVVVTDPTLANAVRVTARRVTSRGIGVPLLFLKVLGRPTYDVQAVSVCQVTAAAQVTMSIPATCNPLPGRPAARRLGQQRQPAQRPRLVRRDAGQGQQLPGLGRPDRRRRAGVHVRRGQRNRHLRPGRQPRRGRRRHVHRHQHRRARTRHRQPVRPVQLHPRRLPERHRPRHGRSTAGAQLLNGRQPRLQHPQPAAEPEVLHRRRPHQRRVDPAVRRPERRDPPVTGRHGPVRVEQQRRLV